MRLPFAPPLAPMLSNAADALPGGEGWQFEPKWDGFRTLVFREGDKNPTAKPRREADEPILPGASRPTGRYATRTLRRRRRDRDRRGRRARLRDPALAHPSR